jgi:hypothetical protein
MHIRLRIPVSCQISAIWYRYIPRNNFEILLEKLKLIPTLNNESLPNVLQCLCFKYRYRHDFIHKLSIFKRNAPHVFWLRYPPTASRSYSTAVWSYDSVADSVVDPKLFFRIRIRIQIPFSSEFWIRIRILFD